MARRYISMVKPPFISITLTKRKNAPITNNVFRAKWIEPFIINGFAYCNKPTRTITEPKQNMEIASPSNLKTAVEYAMLPAIAVSAPVSKPEQPAQ
jgi:hypothetical protein